MPDPDYRYHQDAVTELREIADLIGRGHLGTLEAADGFHRSLVAACAAHQNAAGAP